MPYAQYAEQALLDAMLVDWRRGRSQHRASSFCPAGFSDRSTYNRGISTPVVLQALVLALSWFRYQYGQTSSTITTIGDTLVNFQAPAWSSARCFLDY